MKIWQKTDQGLVRKNNQDACEVRECGEYTIAVVCDGMGGAKAGEIASEIGCHTFLDFMEEVLNEDMSLEQVCAVGREAVAKANAEIYTLAAEKEEYLGMGTTLVAAVCRGSSVVLFNIGDSRAYHISTSGISVLTRDHSWVQDMLEIGEITEEEARNHPNRNLITRAMGTEKTVLCDTFRKDLKDGEYIILCSDGLVNTVSDQEMLYEVVHEEDIDGCLDRLVKIALDRGAPDNVTVILMEHREEAKA